jgi:hypothetical protein
MKLKRVGKYEEHGPRGNHDWGLSLEAVDPVGSRRFVQVSFMLLNQQQRDLFRWGEVVELPFVSDSDLRERL